MSSTGYTQVSTLPVGKGADALTRALRRVAGKVGLATILIAAAVLHSREVFTESFLFAALLILIFIPMAFRLAAGQFDVFETLVMFLAIYFLAYWLRPLLMRVDFEAFSGPSIQHSSIGPEAIRMGLGAAFVGLLAFHLGYFVGLGEKVARLLPRVGGFWRTRRTDTAIAVSGLFFVPVWFYFLKKGHFDLEYMYLNRGAIVQGDAELFFLMMLAHFVFTLLLFCRLLDRLRAPYRPLAFLVPVLMVIPFIVFASRGMLMWTLVPCVVVWHYSAERLRWWQIGILVAGGIAVTSTMGAIRGTLDVGVLRLLGIGGVLWDEMLGQFSYWDNLLLVLSYYPREQEFYYGRILLEELFWPVPRRIWSSKPQFYGGFRVQRDLLPDILDPWTNLGTYEAFSPLGYGYADFGVFGIILAMFTHGVAWRTMYDYFVAQGRTRVGAILYGMVIVNLPGMTRGFVSSLLFLLVFFGPLLLVLRFLTARWQGGRLGPGGR